MLTPETVQTIVLGVVLIVVLYGAGKVIRETTRGAVLEARQKAQEESFDARVETLHGKLDSVKAELLQRLDGQGEEIKTAVSTAHDAKRLAGRRSSKADREDVAKKPETPRTVRTGVPENIFAAHRPGGSQFRPPAPPPEDNGGEPLEITEVSGE